MTGGTIVVSGSVGHETGLLMRRGIIAIHGDCGEFAGASMIAGSLLLFGKASNRLGAGMKRGTILVMGELAELPCSFQYSCDYRPSFLELYLRSPALRNATTRTGSPAMVKCFRGDRLAGGRGEVLLAHP